MVDFGYSMEMLHEKIHGAEEKFIDGGKQKRKEYIHRVIFPKLHEDIYICKLEHKYFPVFRILFR